MNSEPNLSLEAAKDRVKTKTAPRITEDHIRAQIEGVVYTNPFETFTICIITMRNGFHFVGKAAPVSAANFDPEIGQRYAYEDAFKQIWSHEAYLLASNLRG